MTKTAEPELNRTMITVSVMLAAIMTVLDSTIANVALPRMAGAMSAGPDQITWVLTSYIIASAVMTPLTGWLTARVGVKRVFLVTIAGFTVASALCGAAQNLPQIVIFRLVQGAFGATMMPLSQAVMLDAYPAEERGPAMAVWGMGVTVAPIVGPVLGGWLTDDFSWRWVFFINLPIGALCLAGVYMFIPKDPAPVRRPFDFVGFGCLSVALAAFQLFLDRGQNNDWFASVETRIEGAVAAIAAAAFFIRLLTASRPFFPLALFRDRNFVAASVVNTLLGVLVFSILAIVPPMIETLLGYPVVTTGLVIAPRGMGSLVSMFAVGRLVSRVDTRALMIFGLCIFAASFLGMSGFSLAMSGNLIAITGFIQGLGTGFVFTPMTVLAFSTINPTLRGDATGVFALLRNVGNSAGISLLETLFIRLSDVVHSRLAEGVTGFGRPFASGDAAGLARVNGEATRQAAMVAYVDLYHMMFVMTLGLIPIVLFLKPPRAASAPVEPAYVD